MDSPGFPSLVQNFTDLRDEDYTELKKLSDQYPYSQLLHLLMARAARDLKHNDQETVLHQSAVYSTDRQVLKWVMTAPKTSRPTVSPKQSDTILMPETVVVKHEEVPVVAKQETVVVVKEVAAVVEATPAQKVVISQSDNSLALTGDELREDLYAELKKLQKLKHNFEISFDEFQSTKPNGSGSYYEDGQAEKEPAAEPLIEEIKASHKKLKTDNPKQKEQNEIIEQFIKTKPAMPRPKAQASATDLSEDSGMFSDNVVSETLVDILLKQGKKDKAVEVLKKLIWKFPQKKAYFAAQIDKLKS